MTADIFVAAFLGCLLAIVVAGIATWQISAFFVRRKLGSLAKMLAEGVESAADGDPTMRAELDALVNRRSHKGSAMAPSSVALPMISCGACKREKISFFSLSDGGRVALDAGWRVHAPSGELHCPACVEKNSAAAQDGAA